MTTLRSYGGYIYNAVHISAAAFPAAAGVLLAFRSGWTDRVEIYGAHRSGALPADGVL